MSSSTTMTEKVVLKMPAKIGDRIIRVQDIQGKLTGNTYFPSGWTAGTVTQAQFNTDVTAFVSDETAVKAKTPGAVALRDAAYLKLKQDLTAIMAMVQSKADANPTNAVTIINSAGFTAKLVSGGKKRQNAAYNTQIPGTVILTADGSGHHQWEMSKDMVTITILPSTNTSKTTVTALNPGDNWYFRNKKVDTHKNTYNWCSWILLKINAGGRNLGGGTGTGVAGNVATH
jgi:hypothetical protein